MKTDLQKKMRQIRIQLKLHDIKNEEKVKFRKELEKLRILWKKEQEQEQKSK
jgi:hypothetical protein